jgi:pimeloyl-ACP methyl ester carboxylesterase
MRRLIGVGVVVALLLVNTIVTDLETKPAEKGRGGKIVKLSGGDLFYKDEGDRDDPVMVLLHGFSASQRWWDRVTPDLVRRGVRVIRFDLLGHGRSEKPRDGYAPDEQANRVADALRKLHVRRATIVGHSMGGTVASALVEEHPRLVRRIAVLGTSPRDGFAELPLTGRVATWPVVGEFVRRFAPDPLIQAGLDSAFADRVDVPDAFVDDLDGMTFSAYDKSSTEANDYLEAEPNSERIKRSGVPLLVIFGTEDDIVDPKAANAWAEDVPRAHVVRLRGVGHSPQWERSREVVKQLLAFARLR